ncbi:AAA family ATPase [Mesorhizobium sp. M0139]|uniref:ATP-dependent nuclease n=1 Tax=Mesorhizobium sp. M0139 TaxID=2956892 RepID=UPI003335E472
MKINGFQLANYSSFSKTGLVALGPGINIVVGENNAGKSAILRSLYGIENLPHRSPTEFRPERLGSSSIVLDISLSGDEIKSSWLRHADAIYWSLPSSEVSSAQATMDEFLEAKEIRLLVHKVSNKISPMNRPFRYKPASSETSVLFKKENGNIVYVAGNSGPDSTSSLINAAWSDYLFMFDAQRFGLGRSAFGYHERMSSKAENLPGFLSKIQGENTAIFFKLVSHIREIFSTVGNLSVRPTRQNEFEVLVWPIGEQIYPELSVGLNESGTGVAQAIAILAVAMTLKEAVIIIDEISSFLHPAAAKTLLRILQTNYPQHQYIISTHSGEVLSASTPSTVHFVRKSGFESAISPVDLARLEDLRMVTGQLGVSMTDVFAVDRIIWVEGPTEELCFPYVYTTAVGPMPRSTMFVPLIATGDFSKTGTRRDLVLDIYNRLSGAAQRLVTSVTFSFDSEDLSPRQKADLLRRAGANVRLLPRRHFECYLIDPDAIAALLLMHVPDLPGSHLSKGIEDSLLSLGGDPAFKAEKSFAQDLYDPKWLTQVDAAKLIKRVCLDVSEQRFEFSKKLHSLELLKFRMASQTVAGDLIELVDYVRTLVDESQDQQTASTA